MDRARHRHTAVFLAMLAAMCSPAFALDPSLEITQYGHTAWTVRDGFFKGAIYSIAQTADGYLMLGTEFGLVRFDGVTRAAWAPPPGQQLASNNIRTLLAARDGTLWIGTIEGLASWKDGKLTRFSEVAGQTVFTLVEDRDGIVWAGTYALPKARLCGIRGERAECYGEDGSLGGWVDSLYEDSRGRLWAGAATGLWRWKPGRPERYVLPHAVDSDQAMADDEDRSGIIVVAGGLLRMTDGRSQENRLSVRWPFTPLNVLRDRDGGLWIGTLERGVLHVYRGRTDQFSAPDGLSGNHVRCLFEDHEGNIWVGTRDGLDRFRGLAVSSISVKQGISSPSTMTDLVSRDGAVWTSTADGLNRWKDGEVTIYRAGAAQPDTALPDSEGIDRRVRQITDTGLADNEVGSLFEDDRGRLWVSSVGGISRFENGRFTRLRAAPDGYVNGITGDGSGGVWIAYQDRGLYHLVQDHVVEQFPWATLRHGVASAMTLDSSKKGLWLGFFKGRLVHFDEGQVRLSYDKKDGLGPGWVMGLQLDPDGVLWAGTEGGLSRVEDGRILTLTSLNGLPCEGVHWPLEDVSHFFWLYTPCGLVRVARTELDEWASQPDRTIRTTVFDASDGVRLMARLTGYLPRVSRAPDGRIWFAHLDSISVIDPRHLPLNRLPPPVHVTQVIADHKVYWQALPGHVSAASRSGPLPARTRDIQIEYTALSLIAPEKVRFKCKLEGYDAGWQEVGNRRQASYGGLPPRAYRFRVIASNNSDLWNQAGDALEFSIAPAYYQTALFRALATAVVLVALWGLHRLRLYQLTREFHAHLEGRVDERLRVARDLHDTLLQSFQGLLMSFQAARGLLPSRAAEAARVLDTAVDQAMHAIVEARDAVQGMRSSTVRTNDLALSLRVLAEELAAQHRAANGGAAAFSVAVLGMSRALHPILRDDIYRIICEALRNTFHHARARSIEVEIVYDARRLQVQVRDDGKGINAELLRAGRAGHFGLNGMRERARGIGATLAIWSDRGAGTEVELSVPAAVAYEHQPVRRFRLFSKGGATNS